MNDPIVIVSAARTPMGGMLGVFSETPAWKLGSIAIESAVQRVDVDASDIEHVNMGCVLQAGQGQAPARQAARAAKLSDATTCNTINKMCGSGLEAVTIAHDNLVAYRHNIIIAGGMENMTRAPYLLTKARAGYRLGNNELFDHMYLDGLQDAYEQKLMGAYADDTAKKYGFSRHDQDAFAHESLLKAKKAIEAGVFNDEIVPVMGTVDRKPVLVHDDETAIRAKPEKIALLNAAFSPDGTVTAANSSSIADGAAALMLMRESEAKKRGIRPLVKIIGYQTIAQAPQWFTTAPGVAIKRLLDKIDWQTDQVDCFEINEAFAVVTMAAIHDLNLDAKKVNIYGGACALGHPIGASGARILTTLIYNLINQDLKRGVAALCIGGGEATAIAIER